MLPRMTVKSVSLIANDGGRTIDVENSIPFFSAISMSYRTIALNNKFSQTGVLIEDSKLLMN